jgi:hypothetical protein
MIATIATVCLTASAANINHESRAPTFAPGMGMGLRVPGAEPTSLPSGMNNGIPADWPRRQLYNNNADCDCSGAEGAEPTSLPSGMNYGIPADLPRRQLYNNNDDAAAAAAAAMAGGTFIPEAAAPGRRLRGANGKAPRPQLV